MDRGILIAFAVVIAAWVVLAAYLLYYALKRPQRPYCVWCWDDFRADWARRHPDRPQWPDEPPYGVPMLCAKHRFFREAIGETVPMVVATDGMFDEYAAESEEGAWS